MSIYYGETVDTAHELGSDASNEVRADRAEAILSQYSDRNAETDGIHGVATDVSDVLADFLHFCERAGLDFDALTDKARSDARGDLEDGPEARRDAQRFPDEPDAQRDAQRSQD